MNSHYFAITGDNSPIVQAVCCHVLQYKESHLYDWRKLYEVLYGHFITSKYEESAKEKARLECVDCKTSQRIHACMDCIHFACFSEEHIHDHAKEKSHFIAFDTTFGCIYCYECKDYQYDSEFEKIALMLQIEARTNAHYRANIYEPTQELLAFVKQNKNCNLHTISTTHLGVRGIVNLGSTTCFISCMLQVLFHAPVFRNYLLSNKHNNNCLASNKDQCLLQKMSVAAQEFFSANGEAYVPSNLYYAIYQNLQQFAGGEQHDAVHFLSEFLRALHCHGDMGETVPESEDHMKVWGNDIKNIRSPCNCFIGNIFESLAEHTFVCSKCGNKKIQEIPFQCIFYSFEKHHPVEYSENNVHHDVTRKNLNNKGKNTDLSNEIKKGINVEADLENLQWTTPVKDVKEKCCEIQLEIKGAKKKKIPIIISFVNYKVNNIQKSDKGGVRISMKYPKVIDVRKIHLSVSVQAPNLIQHVVTEDSKFLYYLFAIVAYNGDGGVGHYVSCIKQHNKWFRCNDASVEEVENVFNVENILKDGTVYALFYHKQVLDYEIKDRK